jgi:hypothetical protein
MSNSTLRYLPKGSGPNGRARRENDFLVAKEKKHIPNLIK